MKLVGLSVNFALWNRKDLDMKLQKSEYAFPNRLFRVISVQMHRFSSLRILCSNWTTNGTKVQVNCSHVWYIPLDSIICDMYSTQHLNRSANRRPPSLIQCHSFYFYSDHFVNVLASRSKWALSISHKCLASDDCMQLKKCMNESHK